MVPSKSWYMACFRWIAGYWYYASWSRRELMGLLKPIIVLVFMLNNIFDSLSGCTQRFQIGLSMLHIVVTMATHVWPGKGRALCSKVGNKEQSVRKKVSQTSGKQQVEDERNFLFLVIEGQSRVSFGQNLHWRPLFWIFIDTVLYFRTQQKQKSETHLEATNWCTTSVLPWKQSLNSQ